MNYDAENGYEIITQCLLCGGAFKNILSLGKTPLANEFLSKKEDQELFPLNLVQCVECDHVQIDCIVDQERLYRNYVYVSGTNATNVKHFEAYANDVIKRFFSNRPDHLLDKIFGGKYGYDDDLILDVGSNDGTFLKNFVGKIRCHGIDPAKNLANETQKNLGFTTFPYFFDEHIRQKITLRNVYPAKVITCNNMFAHNKNLETIVKGVKDLLSEDGTFIFENSYLLDMVNNNVFDVIYHEHMHHHHLRPLVKFFDKFDMKIYDVERLPNHGGSFRVFVCRKSAKIEITEEMTKHVNDLLFLEEQLNDDLKLFVSKIEKAKIDYSNKLNSLKRNGKIIGIFGYPAKATTFLYGLGIDLSIFDFVVDSATLKQNTFTPGGRWRVYPPEYLYEQNPHYMMILAWNFATSIKLNHKEYKGKWITPIPPELIIDE